MMDNPFNLSRMGYANPAHERAIPTAMRSRPRLPRTPERENTWEEEEVKQDINNGAGDINK